MIDQTPAEDYHNQTNEQKYHSKVLQSPIIFINNMRFHHLTLHQPSHSLEVLVTHYNIKRDSLVKDSCFFESHLKWPLIGVAAFLTLALTIYLIYKCISDRKTLSGSTQTLNQSYRNNITQTAPKQGSQPYDKIVSDNPFNTNKKAMQQSVTWKLDINK